MVLSPANTREAAVLFCDGKFMVWIVSSAEVKLATLLVGWTHNVGFTSHFH